MSRSAAAVTALLHALILSLLLAILPTPSNASDFNAPHSHTGKVSPFSPGDPKVDLSKAKSILLSGSPYQTTIHVPGSTSGRGLVVQDVHAPPDVVWGRILDFDHYTDMVPKTAESKNYQVLQHKVTRKDPLPLEQTIYTKMKVGLPLIPKLTFFVKHLYYPALNSLTWTLDYSKKSDFDDSVGYWYVIPHPELGPSWSRVYYSVSVSMYDWVPKVAVNFMSTKALTDATAWVKKFSEEKWQQDPRRAAMEEGGDGESDILVVETKRKGLGALFARFGQNKPSDGDDGDNTASTSSDTCDSSVDTCDSVEVLSISIPVSRGREVQKAAAAAEGDGKPSKLLTVQGAAVRITLILLVSSLLVYNISLFLDRMS